MLSIGSPSANGFLASQASNLRLIESSTAFIFQDYVPCCSEIGSTNVNRVLQIMTLTPLQNRSPMYEEAA